MTVSGVKYKFLYTSSEKMAELPIINGQFIFCHDKGTLYFDFDDVRKQYGDVTVVSNDTERLATSPLDKSFYYVEDTKSLWFYKDEAWIQISQDYTNIIETLQNRTVGMTEYVTKADVTTVEQFMALESGNYYLTKFSGMMYDVNEEFLMTLYANSRIQIEKGTDSTNIHLITNDGEVIFYNVTTFEQANGDITFTMLKCESYEYNDFTHINERIDEVLFKSKMVVTISPAQTLALDPVNDWVADKTFAEIKEFIVNGGNPILYVDHAGGSILSLSYVSLDVIIFSSMLINNPTAVAPFSDTITMPDFVEMHVAIDRRDVVSVQMTEVAVADIVIDKLSTIDKTVAGAINEINGRVVQSNYEQQDSSQIDYIKNRPCYADESLGTVLFGDTVTFTANGTINYLYEFSSEITLVIGRCYRVIFDEVVYDNLIAYDPWDYGSKIIGNSGYTTEALDSGEYPFQITTQSIRISLNNGDSHSISIVDMSTAYVMLPKEYVSYKPGMVVEKQTFNIDGEEVVAGVCAEIFNNLAENKATGRYSHAEGAGTTASGDQSHAEGSGTTASGYFSHAEGRDTTASNHGSHAEGSSTTASDYGSHAEGSSTTASGKCSHAEGYSTIASNYCSHAEGCLTTASGDYSHAEGSSTTASGDHQHVQGKYNIEDTENKYAHIVGNGKYSKHSNAHTIDWSGNAEYAGDVIAQGCGGETPISLIETSNKVNDIATDEDVIKMLIEADVLPVVADSDGVILTDESGNILIW